jgi:hypothetical protein
MMQSCCRCVCVWRVLMYPFDAISRQHLSRRALQGRLANLQRSVATLLAGAARIEREEAMLRRALETGKVSGVSAAPAVTLPATVVGIQACVGIV